ncbi:MAG: signal peptidase I [Candidatus Melainabacteria bacterium RIFCSPLOWO2_02_FULL_35_15]|nr:MAG: signal peptidase I [Candidatus Melainabacteria bacterium RIFCSPLOWO2_12_FULL_35_11]OGI13064.1 MAG: signal peptidase I [Candidatus Melainabacteria bacterium RIFCSPLOWO2_02_FULL_35_15]
MELIVVTLFLLIIIRQGFIEARYIPSESMVPTLRVNDRLIVEKVTKNLKMLGLNFPTQRGDILVFYPPPEGNRGKDLHYDPLSIFARWTGLPFLPQDDAYIKRVIGLPGDVIEIHKGEGVFINGMLLIEPYVNEVPNYNCIGLADIDVYRRKGKSGKIIVPKGYLFMMGDNRNRSQDSHVWGFLDTGRVVGRAAVIVWRVLKEKPMLLQQTQKILSF